MALRDETNKSQMTNKTEIIQANTLAQRKIGEHESRKQ